MPQEKWCGEVTLFFDEDSAVLWYEANLESLLGMTRVTLRRHREIVSLYRQYEGISLQAVSRETRL